MNFALHTLNVRHISTSALDDLLLLTLLGSISTALGDSRSQLPTPLGQLAPPTLKDFPRPCR